MKSLYLIISNPRYFAAALVFASLNFVFGTWAVYIPTLKETLEIDKSMLGMAIFCLAMGTFSVLPFSAAIIRKFGVGKSTGLGVALIIGTAIFPFIASNYSSLVIALFFLGAAQGFTDIAMNGLVAQIEKEDHQNLMTATHGFFSLGGVLAGMGSFFIPVFQSPAMHMGAVITIVLFLNLYFFKYYKNMKAAIPPKESIAFKHFKPILLLGLISFVVMGSEGAIVDWSGLYLKEIAMAPSYLVGAGFLLFSACMTIARFFGDALSEKMGGVKLIVLGALVAIIGYCFVLTQDLYLSLFGFALNGLGFSVIIPEIFRIAARNNKVEASKAIAVTAGFGYSGFLLTPVFLGFISEKFGMIISFSSLLFSVSVVFLLGVFMLNKKASHST